MDKQDYIVFGKPLIGEAEKAELVDSLDKGWLGTGPKVKRFERDFAAYKKVAPEHVAAVNSCTAALHLSLIAAGVGPGDEVITTALTFCATVNAIIHAGATPVLADIEPDTWNIDPGQIERRISARTRAIIPVHFSGTPCDMGAIMDIAGKHGLKVIEDCAHAIESRHAGRPLGTLGDFGCFSFYVTKNMTTGEGGMVVAKSRVDIDRVRTLALHGMSADAWARFSDDGYKHYAVVEPGFKYNMMDIQAALGIHQLAGLENNLEKRRIRFGQYRDALAGLPLQLPVDAAAGDRAAYHLFPVLVGDGAALTRDQFMTAMHKAGIGTGVHYLDIPSHRYYSQRYGWSSPDYPVAHRVGRTTVSLPFSATMTDAQIARVLDTAASLLLGRQVE